MMINPPQGVNDSIARKAQADYFITPSDIPQTIIDAVPAGSVIAFTSGTHEHGLPRNNAMISVEKQLTLIIPPTVTLKVADGLSAINHAEIITNFHISNPISSTAISADVGGLTTTVAFNRVVVIDSTGAVDTFSWGTYDTSGNVYTATGVAITGDWQTLDNGLKIKFASVTGHNLSAGCIISVTNDGYYTIRIGTGTNITAIDGVIITGGGTVDQNQNNNGLADGYALNLNSGIWINGKVTNTLIENIVLANCQRQIWVCGENVGGTFNTDGTVTGGTSYDVDGLTIRGCRSTGYNYNGYLFGMPEHRGYVKNVLCENNIIKCNNSGIEPNNLLQNYVLRNNHIISSGGAIGCWRYSAYGEIYGNTSEGNSSNPVVLISYPAGWHTPENIRHWGNTNLNLVKGLSNIDYGYKSDFVSGIAYSSARGREAKAKFTGHHVLASSKILAVGDAQFGETVIVAKTTDATVTLLRPNQPGYEAQDNTYGFILIDANSAVGYRIRVVGTQEGGANYAYYTAEGLIKRAGTASPVLYGNTITTVYESNSSWNVEVLASSTYNALVVRATGAASQNIKWVAYVELLEAVY